MMMLFCVCTILVSTLTVPVYAMESDFTVPSAEIIFAEEVHGNSNNDSIHYLTDSTRATKKPSTDDTWDIYLQDYVFNLNFSTALYTDYNFTNHGGEIKVTVTCLSSNPTNIKMELYEAGETTCLATLELDPDGTTSGRFYNLALKTNYYFKFVSDDGYSVRGEGRLYKESE